MAIACVKLGKTACALEQIFTGDRPLIKLAPEHESRVLAVIAKAVL